MEDNSEPKVLTTEELVDDIAKKVVSSIRESGLVKKVRRSELLSILLGIIGFSIFTGGVSKIFANFPGILLLILGLILMVVGGVSIRNILR